MVVRSPKPREKKPVQERSRKTRERILDAAERLLRKQAFETITIADLVREARSSVGAFYARFGDKTVVLEALYARYDRRIASEHKDTIPEFDSLEEQAEEACRRIVKHFRERRWFLRAMGLHARLRPQAIPDEMRKRRAGLHRRMAEPFARFASERDDDAAIQAAEWGLFVVIAAVRDKVLFGESPHAASLVASDDELVAQLTRTLVGYLRASRIAC